MPKSMRGRSSPIQGEIVKLGSKPFGFIHDADGNEYVFEAQIDCGANVNLSADPRLADVARARAGLESSGGLSVKKHKHSYQGESVD